jgi:hypothetical protein
MTNKHSLCHRHRRDDDRTPSQVKKTNWLELFTIFLFYYLQTNLIVF